MADDGSETSIESLSRAAAQAALAKQERRGWFILGGAAAAVAVACVVAGIVCASHGSAPPPAPTAEVGSPPVPPVVIQPSAAELVPLPLDRREVREVQTRLFRFGFDPGPADGDAGHQTRVAAARYEQKKGLPGTGSADRALLDALRQDPAPQIEPPRQIANRGSWRDTPASSAATPARRSPGFLDSLRSADNSLGHWLNSIGR